MTNFVPTYELLNPNNYKQMPMKRHFLFLFLLVLAIGCIAQSGTRLQVPVILENGYEMLWNTYYSMGNNGKFKKAEYALCDTICIGGTIYREVAFKDGHDTLYYRQDGQKVFCFRDGKELLVLDFGLKEGEVFTNPQGKEFVVTNISPFEDFIWPTPTFHNYSVMLHLQSKEGSEEDTWIEGIGSLNWGIIPTWLVKDITDFTEIPVLSKLIDVRGDVITTMFKVNEEDYKCNYFIPEHNDTELNWECSFVSDTLFVKGNAILHHKYTLIECSIKDNVVDISLTQRPSEATDHVNRDFYTFIPGFKTGVYQVGLLGKNHVTLECKGTADGIERIRNEKNEILRDSNILYNLSGRRTVHPTKGICIRRGRKVVK